MITILSTKGQIVIPLKIRKRQGFRPGDELVIEEKDNAVLIQKKHSRNEGLVDFLLSCPVKGFKIPKMRNGSLRPPKI